MGHLPPCLAHAAGRERVAASQSGESSLWYCPIPPPLLVLQCEKPAAFKCATFGASLVEDRHLATGDYNGGLSVW